MGFTPGLEDEPKSEAFQELQRRAEDIVCLRSSSSYVSRQQNVPARADHGQDAHSTPAIASNGSNAENSKESQKELMDKLLYLAVMQINSVKPGTGGGDIDTGTSKRTPKSSDADVAGGPRVGYNGP